MALLTVFALTVLPLAPGLLPESRTPGVPDGEQGLATGLVTSTQQVGITVGIPLLGVLATTSGDLLSGVHTVLALDAVIVLSAAVLAGLGLRRGQSSI